MTDQKEMASRGRYTGSMHEFKASEVTFGAAAMNCSFEFYRIHEENV